MARSALVTQRQLLQLLSSGEFQSGQRVADELGLSRTAVANHIKLLQELGLDIYKVKGRGYRLAQPLTLLDAATIIKLKAKTVPDVLVQSITDSTNSQLMHKVTEGTVKAPGYVIVADAQTAGRGRRGTVAPGAAAGHGPRIRRAGLGARPRHREPRQQRCRPRPNRDEPG